MIEATPMASMEAYLARKRANSPRYALVPEVRFLRTRGGMAFPR